MILWWISGTVVRVSHGACRWMRVSPGGSTGIVHTVVISRSEHVYGFPRTLSKGPPEGLDRISSVQKISPSPRGLQRHLTPQSAQGTWEQKSLKRRAPPRFFKFT